LVHLVARGELSLRIVDLQEHHRLTLYLDNRIVLPSRKNLQERLLPEVVEECKEQTLKILRTMDTVAIPFDLWMSRKFEDVLELITHGIDENFDCHHLHIRLLRVIDTSGSTLSESLRNLLDKFGLTGKTLAYVKDGGASLRTFAEAVDGIVSSFLSSAFGVFHGPCVALALSGACNAAMKISQANDFELMNFKYVHETLRRCITWIKKEWSGTHSLV
jgi:hypothetical protein